MSDSAFRRGIRRHHDRRILARVLRIARLWGKTTPTDPTFIGRLASTHAKPCSCYMCGNPRRYFGEPTLRERRMSDPEVPQ